MKLLSFSGVALGVAGTITPDDIVIILGVIVTISNILLEFIKWWKQRDVKDSKEDL